MTPEGITRRYGGVNYLLKDITLTQRSADFVAGMYRNKGFVARVEREGERRFGI